MKSTRILILATSFVLMLATTFVIASFVQSAESTSGLVLQSKIGLAQIDTDLSEVGSTTGIFIMGIVIALIISAPLIFRKKKH